MTVRVGVIGTGMIGQDHIRRLSRMQVGATVVAVNDIDVARASQVALGLPEATVHRGDRDLIADPRVDAVLVASAGDAHEGSVLACLAAGKPVFCEKPLATSEEACRRIVDAEVAVGRRLLQVGYMRRYDAGYRALKTVLDSGSIGAALMVHCAHRNRSVPERYTRDMAITDTAVHEFDALRWLLGDEIVAATVLKPRRSRHSAVLQDPLLVLLETVSGVLVDVEVSVNIRYGYEIRCEVVGEDGTAELAASTAVLVRSAGVAAAPIPADWRERFARAYDDELQEWLGSIVRGTATGPSSWDGLAAAAVSDAALASMHGGGRRPIRLPVAPALYA